MLLLELVSKADWEFPFQVQTATSAATAGTTLIEDEKAAVGGVQWAVYRYYGKSVGYGMMAFALVLYSGYQGFSVGSSIWLSKWSTDPKVSNMYSFIRAVWQI